MPKPAHSYLSPKLEARQNPAKGGKGIFALQAIEPGELLIVWDGIIVPYERLIHLPAAVLSPSVQVEEGLSRGRIVPVPSSGSATGATSALTYSGGSKPSSSKRRFARAGWLAPHGPLASRPTKGCPS